MESGGVSSTHGLEIIEDTKSNSRRRNGLPSRYVKGRFLGKGGFAKCYEITDMVTNEVFAAKIVAKASIAKPRAHAKLKSEISIHRSINHERVVKFYDYFEDSEFVYIILEVCTNNTLNEFMRKRPGKRLSEPEALFYIYDLVTALSYLHQHRIIHRDLKLGNLFLDSNVRLKVGDFGLAAQLEHDNERRRTICGTPNYIAPEIVEGKHGHSYEVDIWSLGVILYTMLIGRPPFETSDVKATYRRIRYNQYDFPDNVHVSQQAKDLITSILRTDPRCRPSLDEILASPWFQSSNRLPPSMPVSVAAMLGASPRPVLPVGGSSARSETPDREGVDSARGVDFARIDSPVPRCPLRDRSPSVDLQQARHQPLASTRELAGSVVNKLQPSGSGTAGTVSGKFAAAGGLSARRPPLAHLGNDENTVPSNGNGADAGNMHASAASPKTNQALLGSTGFQGRMQNRPLTACGSGARIGAHPASPIAGATTTSHSNVRPGLDGNLLHGRGSGYGGSSVPAPPRASCTSSPRDATPCGALTSRFNPVALSGRTITPSNSEGRGTYGSHTNRAIPTLATFRASGGGSGGSSPGLAQGPAYSGRRPSPGASEDPPAQARTSSLATLPKPTQGERSRQASAPHSRRGEWSASTPTLSHDAPQLDPCTPTAGVSRSARGGAPSEPNSGVCVLASSSRRCPSPSPNPSTHVPLASHDNNSGLPDLWVTKWVDYSNKYGVGYIISDGAIGVFFNDSTKIILVPDGSQFDYITRRMRDKPETRSTHSLDDYPEDLKKKVTLLKHFKNYMVTDSLEMRDGATVGVSGLPTASNKSQLARDYSQLTFVKKWTRNKSAIMFQLSNKIVQTIFSDKTETVLSSTSRMVTYVNKKGLVTTHPLSSVQDVSSPDFAKRLRYTKDILVNMLGPQD